jgi:hypothetical protein
MSPPTPEPAEDARGTHPLSILGLAAGGFSLVFGGTCSLLDPRLGALNHALLGLIALGCGLWIRARVRAQHLEDSNLLQARWATALGAASLVISLAWALWIARHPLGY